MQCDRPSGNCDARREPPPETSSWLRSHVGSLAGQRLRSDDLIETGRVASRRVHIESSRAVAATNARISPKPLPAEADATLGDSARSNGAIDTGKTKNPPRKYLGGFIKSAITYFPAEQYHRLQGLNFCVRDGNRCDPLHMVTDKSTRTLSAS